MNPAFSKVLDGALVVALLSSLMYFLGVANIQGDAGAYNVPTAVLQGDIWSTVAEGGQGLMVTLMSPFTFFTSEVDWLLLALIFVVPIVLLIVVGLWKSLRGRKYILAVLALVGIYLLVFFCSLTSASSTLLIARDCVVEHKCLSLSRVGVLIELVDKSVEKRQGVILSLNSNYLVLLTKESTVIVPTASVKIIESLSVVARPPD